MLPQIKHIHYYTDSPTSQYRNKTIFYLLSHHKELFGVSTSCNFFDAGHGKKVPVMVLEVLSNRCMADEAVRQQKVTIQDASDFFAWTEQHQSSSSVSFSFVSKETCSAAQSEIERFGELKPVPGTMSVHAVAAISRGKVITRETSCHCQQCFTNGRFNPESPCLWKQHMLKEFSEEVEVVPVVGDWVAAAYDDKWYVGKVLAVDLAAPITMLTYHSCKTPQSNLVSISGPPQPISSGFSSSLSWLLSSLLSLVENLSGSTS